MRPAGVDVFAEILGVVHSGQQGQEIGCDLQGISLPARSEVGDLVSADTAVHELPALVRACGSEVRGHEKGVAVAELIGGVDFLRLAEGVGDRVTLE